MSWEAFRLTSKSPGELLTTLGPHGVDHLIRQALDTLWREYPEESRTLARVERRAREVFERNLKVWRAIKKPTPQSFFENLAPYPADGHIRQAFVLSWMMLPRTGGRKFSDTHKLVSEIFERNIEGWREDWKRFTTSPGTPAMKKKTTKAQRHKGKKKK
jgi:hypothetical protein